ncbi:hypothetical protein [Clostridium thermarum]|uniref:hypothetical protein n=1 Tax=Clostridium thermarum TaxID=1716543 RepID=UPI00193FA997|nr:hypothetical protein [Clostridium thermarum]
MKGKVLDKNITDAFIALETGETIDISTSRLPKDVKIGDTVDIPINNTSISNDKLVDFF